MEKEIVSFSGSLALGIGYSNDCEDPVLETFCGLTGLVLRVGGSFTTTMSYTGYSVVKELSERVILKLNVPAVTLEVSVISSFV